VYGQHGRAGGNPYQGKEREMEETATLLLVSDSLSDALELEEDLWRQEVGVVVEVITPEELPHAMLAVMPDIVVFDVRRSSRMLHQAWRCVNCDEPGVGPSVIVVTDIPRLVGWLHMPEMWCLVTAEGLVRTVRWLLQHTVEDQSINSSW
jgi:DNA-binding NarL/FixJ family response regulator